MHVHIHSLGRSPLPPPAVTITQGVIIDIQLLSLIQRYAIDGGNSGVLALLHQVTLAI